MPKQMDILCSETSLYNAWNIVREKGSAGGIDGVTIQEFENEKLKLSLNKPISIISLSDKFDFLGITIKNAQACITEKKREELNKRILSLEMDKDGLTTKSQKTWDGIANYYAQLLPENDLESFDAYLLMRLQTIIAERAVMFPSKTGLQMALSPINFLSKQYQARKKLYIGELVADYIARKNETKLEADIQKNKRLIQQRKKEFRKLSAETSGLLVDKPGTFIGMTSRGLTVMEKGKVIAQHHAENLSHVVECMLTDIQYKSMCKRLAKIVVRKEDWVNIYPLCTECYARIEYIPPVKKKEPVKIAVV